MYKFDVERITRNLIEWIKVWFDENGKGCNAVLGMSGGKDSTVCAALLAKALGPERVIGVMMPDFAQSLNDADKICEYLGIRCINAPIKDITLATLSTDIVENGVALSEFSGQSVQNLPPRCRMIMLYLISQTLNGRVINTCNLSENMIGYETIYGDAAGDVSPLGDLTVTEILQIGDYLGLPYEWVHKTPDDGLPNSSPDEEKFGFTYELLDSYIRNGFRSFDDSEKESIQKIRKMIISSEFKRNPMQTFKNLYL